MGTGGIGGADVITPDRSIATHNFYSGWPHGRPRAVMIHSTRSGQRHFTDALETSATINWFTLRHSGASSQWLITASGEKIRIVPDADRAWHAKEHSDWSYGIELTQPTINRPYTDGHYRGLAEVCRGYLAMGVPAIHITRFANGAQGFTGHEESEQGIRDGKSDPGPAFDWLRFISMLHEEDDMAAMEEIEKLRAEVWAVNKFQNEILIGQKAAIDLLAGIAVNHEKRITDLARPPR